MTTELHPPRTSLKSQLENTVSLLSHSGIQYSEAVAAFRRQFIETTLFSCDGNQCRAARELGMHRNTLSRTMAELGIDFREFRPKQQAQRCLYSQKRRSVGVPAAPAEQRLEA